MPISVVLTTLHYIATTVSDLRAALSLRGLSTEGLKVDLVNRLQARLDEEEFGMVDAPVAGATAPPAAEEAAPIKETPVIPAAAAAAEVPAKEKVSAADAGETKNDKDEEKPVEEKEKPVEEKEKPVEEKEKPVEEPVKITKDMTFEEKKRARAARFGIPLTETEKRKTRADRFGDKKKDVVKKQEVNGADKKKEAGGGGGKKDDKQDKKRNNTDNDIQGGKKQKQEQKVQQELLPKEEIEKRLERLNKFGGTDKQEEKDKLKSMLRKYRFM